MVTPTLIASELRLFGGNGRSDTPYHITLNQRVGGSKPSRRTGQTWFEIFTVTKTVHIRRICRYHFPMATCHPSRQRLYPFPPPAGVAVPTMLLKHRRV